MFIYNNKNNVDETSAYDFNNNFCAFSDKRTRLRKQFPSTVGHHGNNESGVRQVV